MNRGSSGAVQMTIRMVATFNEAPIHESGKLRIHVALPR